MIIDRNESTNAPDLDIKEVFIQDRAKQKKVLGELIADKIIIF